MTNPSGQDPAPLLAVEGLRKTYPLPGKGRLTAADGIGFTVPAGGSLGIVGESGSGKTTVARMLVGLVRPDAGTVRVEGRVRGLAAHAAGRPASPARGRSRWSSRTPTSRSTPGSRPAAV